MRFEKALASASSPLIAEIKPHSPEHGDLLRGRSVQGIAADYAAAGAACLSVTTGKWHRGQISMLAEASRIGLPVLRKDFITTRRDIEESADAGASAVLLTCTLLRKADVSVLAQRALDSGLTPFVEAASRSEIAGLDLPDGVVLAVNNRNIRQQERDSGGVERSLDLYRAAREITDGLVVSASGLLAPRDASCAIACGFNGVLVGSSLLREPHGVYFATRAFVEALTAKTTRENNSGQDAYQQLVAIGGDHRSAACA